jgi:alpha-1,6-mannosyltransferase
VETPLGRVIGRPAARRAAAVADRYARWVHARLDLTLVSSPDRARALTAGGVPNVEQLSLGADVRTFHPGRRDPAWRGEIGAGERDLVLIHAGRLDREKRIDVLVEAVKCLPSRIDARLVLLGQGPERSRWERAAAADPRLVVLPFERDRDRVARALASADVYVSAARFETFGLAVVEAQASGLPVVGQRAGAMIDRVDASCGILLPDLDPEGLARAVPFPGACRAPPGGGRAHLGADVREALRALRGRPSRRRSEGTCPSICMRGGRGSGPGAGRAWRPRCSGPPWC